MCKFCEGHAPLITTGCIAGHNIDVGIYENKMMAESTYTDDFGIAETIAKACIINYCPVCGENIGGK